MTAPDLLGRIAINWNAVEAVGTLAAAFAAIFAALVAIYAPQWQRRRDRSEATAELLSAVREAVLLFDEAKMVFARAAWRDSASATLAAKADHLRLALDRLIDRPELTDGAIIAGAGAMRLLGAIGAGRDRIFEGQGGSGFGRRALEDLAPLDPIVPVVEDRAVRVARYAVKRRWPKYRKRFAAIAQEGIRA